MENHSQPAISQLNQIISALDAQQFAQAEREASMLCQKYPQAFMPYYLLGVAQNGLEKYTLAIQAYQQAIRLQSNVPEIHFNLGIAYAHTSCWDDAILHYRKAIQLNPQFFEAYGNLGAVLQKSGLLSEAVDYYRKALTIHQDARGYFNLATALRDQGNLDDAIVYFQSAIEYFERYVDAYNYLGECWRDKGDMPAAVQAYQHALELAPNHAGANYNMGEFLYLAQRFDEAVIHFEMSRLDDWQERSLYCMYKAEKFTEFKKSLDEICHSGRKHTSPLVACLSAHYAHNFGLEDSYNFCRNSFDFVYQRNLPELAEGSGLLKSLLHDIETSVIAERKQAMLHAGKQSAGSLFKRSEASFRTLAELVKQEFIRYKQHFAGASCELIASFPSTLEFTSSWYIKMQRGGYLSPHMHEIGWISGAVYLALPARKQSDHEGAFEYGLHGDNYPQKQSEFPRKVMTLNVGDIVLFPSSLFHRTLPFNSDEARICIAFDLKPQGSIFTGAS